MVDRVLVGKYRTPAIIMEPDKRPPWPAVVLAHGMWASAESVVPFARRLTARGILAIAVDLRGNRPPVLLKDVINQDKVRQSAKDYLNLVAHLSLMSARDIAAVCDELREQNEVRSDRIGLWGNSLGCQAVLAAIPLSKPAVAVGAYGNADWDLMWRLSWPYFHPDLPRPGPQWAPSVQQLIGDLDPVHHIDEFFPTALLLQHGRDDHPMVDGMTSLHERLVSQYKREPDRLRFQLFDGGHQMPLTAEQGAVDWLEHWLG